MFFNNNKGLSYLHLTELLVLQVNSTEADNQTGKSKSGWRLRFAPLSSRGRSNIRVVLCAQRRRAATETATRTGRVNPPARGSTAADALRASMATSAKVLAAAEPCSPAGMWSPALEEAAVMMDYCNYHD